MKKLLSPLAAAVAALSLAVVPAISTVPGVSAVAKAQAPSVVTQGHLVQTSSGLICSLGFVEAERAWTASHCGVNGQAMYNEFGSHIGTLHYLNQDGATGHDLAYIQFASGTVAGGNPITGDGVQPPPPAGTPVCVTGIRSGRNCSAVVNRPLTRPGMFSTLELFKVHGDSGSAAFVPGRDGVVGIYSGTSTLRIGADTRRFENIAALPSAQERAAVPYQGRVARKPDIHVGKKPGDFLEVWFRKYLEPMEALGFLSSRGFSWADVKGFLAVYGLLI